MAEAIFAEVNAHLTDKGITLRWNTLLNATIINAPSLTKNKSRARDPEVSSTKKGNHWFFGMKAHIGVDVEKFSTAARPAFVIVLRQGVWASPGVRFSPRAKNEMC